MRLIKKFTSGYAQSSGVGAVGSRAENYKKSYCRWGVSKFRITSHTQTAICAFESMCKFCFALSVYLLISDTECLAKARIPIQPRPIIFVYSDGSADHFAEFKIFVARMNLKNSPQILDGKLQSAKLPENWKGRTSLVLFAKSSHVDLTKLLLPNPFAEMIAKMPDYDALQGKQVLSGINIGPVGCYGDMRTTKENSTKYFDLYANFDPLNDPEFCRAQAYAAVLGLGWDYCKISDCKALMRNK